MITDEFSRLLQTLNNSKILQENNALYQTIRGLILSVEKLKNGTNDNEAAIAELIIAAPSDSVEDLDATNNAGVSEEYSRGDHKHGYVDNTIASAKLIDTAVTPGTYGDASNVGQFTVNSKGQLTSAINVPITGAGSADYVVMSDGATPTPAPTDDGFGNFIYIAYTP